MNAQEVAECLKWILEDENRIVEEIVLRPQYNGIERMKKNGSKH